MTKESLETKTERALNWYPGHMEKAIKQIKAKLSLVDIVFEIRDARAPLYSANPALDEVLAQKLRIIVVNKANLVDTVSLKNWENWFKQSKSPVFILNCFDKTAMKKLLQFSRQSIADRKTNTQAQYTPKLKAMVIGLPNTGKSTFINQMAGKNIAKAADKPGQTQTQQWINVDSSFELLDTPGVMTPLIATDEQAMALCAIYAIPDHVVGEERPARYLLNILLNKKSPELKARYKLDSFDLDLEQLIEHIAKKRGCIKAGAQTDYEKLYKLVLHDFRSGDLGLICLQQPD
jgi:ribosome biogenesis GTPase A